MGNRRPLRVSPLHRMLVRSARAEMLFGDHDVLVTAQHLVDGQDVRRLEGGTVTYVHLLFDRHEILRAEGALSESFHPGAVALSTLDLAAREEILALFPDLTGRTSPAATARRSLSRWETVLLRPLKDRQSRSIRDLSPEAKRLRTVA